jgi:hypothetical protein
VQRSPARGKITSLLESWLGVRWILRRACGVARFELGSSLGEFLRNFAQKLRGAALGFRGDFFFNETSKSGELFVEAVANFFESVHFPPRRPLALRAGKRIGAIPVL